MLPPYPYAEKLSTTIPCDLYERMEIARSRLKVPKSIIVQSALEVYLAALDRAERLIDEDEKTLAA